MRHWLRQFLAALACGLGVAVTAWAQAPIGRYTSPYQNQPTLSPYLNMLRSGTSPAINYHSLVRPQMETSQNLSNLQQQFQQLDSTMLAQGTTTGTPTAGSFLTTGHPVAFMNYGNFFPLYTRGGAGGIRGG